MTHKEIKLLKSIKRWAKANYETSHGASTIIECYDDEQILIEFKTLKAAKERCKLLDEQNANVICEIF